MEDLQFTAQDARQAQAAGVRPMDPWLSEAPEPEINIMEYLLLVWNHRWTVLAVVAITVLLAGARAFTQPKLYRSVSKVAIEPTPQITRSQTTIGVSYYQMQRHIQNQIQVLKTETIAQRVIDRMGLEQHPELGGQSAALSLAGRVSVSPMEDTDIIVVSLAGPDPDNVAELLNLYVEEFIAANIEDSLERSRKVYEVIQSRLDPLRDQLTSSEQELVEFREREDALLFADQDKNVISEQVNTLTSEYAQAKAERIRLETRLNALNRLRYSSNSLASFPEILQDQASQGLVKQRNELEVELSDKLRTYKEGHPVIKELRTRLEGIDRQIREQITAVHASVKNDYEMVSQRERSLFANIQQLKQQSIELSKQTLEYDRLRREYDQNKAFLSEMLARSKEFDISAQAVVNNMRVIEPARPATSPFSPNIRRTLSMAMALGLFLGVGLVFGLDFLDQTLRTPEQIERYLGIDVLSALPVFSEERNRALIEAFQTLRTALMLAARGEGCQILQITSAAPAEGKTTISFNLAKVFASGGARVLLVDADLRKPRLHRLIKTGNTRGLTNVVLGESQMGEVIHAIAASPNLDVITTGPLPSNPPELYGKGTFRRMLDEARASYDWVLVDTPPVVSVTDPVICSQLVDLVLLVIEYAKTKRQVIKEAVRQLTRTNVRLAGALLNKVDLDRDQYYYSYYSYYRYGYYSDDAEQPSAGKAAARAHHSSSASRSRTTP